FSPCACFFCVDNLQMPQFVKQHVVQHETPNGENWPLNTTNSAEHLWSLSTTQCFCQTEVCRHGTQAQFSSAAIDIAENAMLAAIVEMNVPEPRLNIGWQALKNGGDFVFTDVVAAMVTVVERVRGEGDCHCKGFVMDLIEAGTTPAESARLIAPLTASNKFT